MAETSFDGKNGEGDAQEVGVIFADASGRKPYKTMEAGKRTDTEKMMQK